MRKNNTGSYGIALLIGLCVVIITSCKKDKATDTTPLTGALSDQDSLKYLMYRLMEKTFVDDGRDSTTNFPLYFWYDKVPELNPLSSQFSTAQNLLDKMMSYTVGNNGKPLDRYTFMDDGTVASELQGVGGDMGLDVGLIRDDQSNKVYGVVLSVAKGSPAADAGVQRGWYIINIDNKSGEIREGTQYQQDDINQLVDAIFNNAQTIFGFRKLDGSSVTITLAKTQYNINPVLFDTVYNVGGRKVGYFVFSSFTDIFKDNNTDAPSLTQNELNRVFSNFASKNISALIVDLRYNGGGSVTTAQYLSNKIAPASANNKLMFRQQYNALLQPVIDSDPDGGSKSYFGDTSLTNHTQGPFFNLNLTNGVFFIGTNRTASASELVMNNLRPYMPVKLVGDTTYGKPVGSVQWPISIFKNGQEQFLSYLFPIAFDMHNADGVGDYYDGMIPDEEAVDYVDLPWGDVRDDNLSKIFSFIGSGSFGRTSALNRINRKLVLKSPYSGKIPSLRYNGMIDRSGKINRLLHTR